MLKTVRSEDLHTMKAKKKSRASEGIMALSKKDRRCRKVIEYGILGLIVFSPLPAASVYEWSILVIQLTVLVMMSAYLIMREKPENNEQLSAALKWPKYLFFGFFVFIFIQIIPLPKIIVKLFSPNTYSFHELYTTNFSGIKFMSLSLMPSHTLQKGIELLSYVLLGFLIVKTVVKRRQIMRIFYVLAAMGAFEAFYGLFELYNKNPRILFFKKIHYLDAVTGTFVNRNHLSGYLEMLIPLTIGLILARVDFASLGGLKLKEKILRISEKGIYTNILLSLGIIAMALAVIFSKSRSGVFLLVLTFILFFELIVLYFGMGRQRQKWIKTFLVAVFLVITFISLYVGIDATIERFEMENILKETRPTIWGNTVRIISDFPLFGTGFGTYPAVYAAYEEKMVPFRAHYSHNDYLEYLSDGGAVGFALLLGSVLFILVKSFLYWRVRRHPQVKGLALGGIIAVVLILIHSISDFNLQIPANMLLFTVVLSMTVGIAYYRRSEEGKVSSEELGVRSKKQGVRIRIKRRGMNVWWGKVLLICALVVVGVVAAVFYWSQHLYHKAENIEDNERKEEVLNAAEQIYPFNDLVFHGLGNAYFGLGIENLEDNTRSSVYLEKSTQNFNRSIRLNPASAFCHFSLAQSLFYMSYISPSSDIDFYEEYRKAALLSGHNSDIFYEVGKIFLSNWPRLSDGDREFALEILEKTAKRGDSERLESLMYFWDMNARDYEAMERILPENAWIYRMYAKILGEKSLSPEERQKVLIKAELMEYERAKSEFDAGENLFLYMRVRDAFNHYKSCLDILERIRFYQDIVGVSGDVIDISEFYKMQKTACLKLSKCRLVEGRELQEVEGYLRRYLELEDRAAAVGELESYLKGRGLIKENMGEDLGDLEHLSFQMFLCFKQNRYSEIIRVGNLLQASLIAVPEAKKKEYVEILQLVGDSFQKSDYVYDAADFYQKALEIDPENMGILFRVRQNYERLNDDEEVRKINKRIEMLMMSEETKLENLLIRKGRRFSRKLALDGSKMTLELHFGGVEGASWGAEERRERGEKRLGIEVGRGNLEGREVRSDERGETVPMISVFFNGKVVWEDYLRENILSIPVESRVGMNDFQVAAVNRSVNILKIVRSKK